MCAGIVSFYKWINTHRMPAHWMGRLWKFKKDEVNEWVKAGGVSRISSDDGKRKKR